jgi:CRISPR-associated protein Cas2
MLAWIIYDISEDKARLRISKLCLRAGLYRVQESVFLGQIERVRYDELFAQFSEIIDPETDRIYFSPVSMDDFDRIQILGKPFDRRLVSDQLSEIFF